MLHLPRKSFILRASVFTALAFLLGGCLTSLQPKFSRESAVAALGDGGRYAVFEREDGNWKRDEGYGVTHRPDGAYDLINEKGDVLTISFHNFTDGQFIGQTDPEKGKQNFGYVVIRKSGDEMLVFVPRCDQQDKQKLAAAGVVIQDYECSIDKVADPATLFRTLNLGEPTSKLVRE